MAVARRELLLVGDAHGVHASREPAVLYELAHALGARALALEWSHDQVGEIVRRFMRTGTFDLEAVWALPAGAEAFSGDGRFTAGHVALLERLHREGTLEQVILIDRLDPDPLPPAEARDRDMAERLLAEWDRALPLLAVVGAGHVASIAALIGATETAMLDYRADVELPPAALTFAVPHGPPAVVPGR
ncbi:MAG: hypothetical protein ACJ757_10825 [Gaiellaceae bacterium]